MSFGSTIDTAGLGHPPIGSGNYLAWFVFVFVILLAVILAEWIIAGVGIKK
jgi:hypothetical protein